MNEDLGLRVLGNIMDWDNDRAHDEFDWLRLMSRLKYDTYRDFHAGARFIENLAIWLQQFAADDREAAYGFVRRRLVFVSAAEMGKLVEQFYPNRIQPDLIATVAEEVGIPSFRVLANSEAQKMIEIARRRTLFMGVSDGARVDLLRHRNIGRINNEQVVSSTQIDPDKWRDLLENLRSDTGDPSATFRTVYLIDDFAGTGTSFFRHEEGKGFKGKLVKFGDSLTKAANSLGSIVSDDWQLRIHHYLGTSKARTDLEDRISRAGHDLPGLGLPASPIVSWGTVMPDSLPFDPAFETDAAFAPLLDKHYDSVIETVHTAKGGTASMKLGYGGCALPVVLEHNTPNNSLPLLWAETDGEPNNEGQPQAAMRPLFHRRQRHL